MTWETSTKTVTCRCGRVYYEKKTNLPVRDKDNYVCKCGHELNSWNGGVMYSYAVLSEPIENS